MTNHKLIAPIAGSLAALTLVAYAGAAPANSGATPPSGDPNRGLPQGSEAVRLHPADFTTKIDNPYWPMSPGSKWVYDWYAQDKQGNIWYLGEAVRNYKHGKLVDRAGSFEAGVKGAQAGVAMPANPVPGLSYRQEYFQGVAEDKAAVITVGQEQVEVPFGYFNKNVLMTRDLVPTEPRVQELKFYAPGVGPLLSMHTDGTGGHAALISYTKGSP